MSVIYTLVATHLCWKNNTITRFSSQDPLVGTSSRHVSCRWKQSLRSSLRHGIRWSWLGSSLGCLHSTPYMRPWDSHKSKPAYWQNWKGASEGALGANYDWTRARLRYNSIFSLKTWWVEMDILVTPWDRKLVGMVIGTPLFPKRATTPGRKETKLSTFLMIPMFGMKVWNNWKLYS